MEQSSCAGSTTSSSFLPSNLNLVGPPNHYQLWSSSSSTTSSRNSSFSHRWRRFVQKRYDNEWSKRNVIEEGDYEEEEQPVHKRLEMLLLLALLLVALFVSLCFVLWTIFRNYNPDFAIQNLEYDGFYTTQGIDHGGVPTKLVTLNCSSTVWIHNSAPSLGIHVEPVAINIKYSEMSIATGHSKKIYIPNEAQRTMTIVVQGNMVPLYGEGARFPDLRKNINVPLTMDVSLTGERYVCYGEAGKDNTLQNCLMPSHLQFSEEQTHEILHQFLHLSLIFHL